METEPAHWFDLGRIAQEAPFTVPDPEPEKVKIEKFDETEFVVEYTGNLPIVGFWKSFGVDGKVYRLHVKRKIKSS